MDKKTKQNIVITTFLLCVAGCAAAVLFGIWFHDEPTFAVDGMIWNRNDVPLRICIANYEGEVDDKENREIVESINKRFNFHLLSYLGELDERCVIQGTLGVPYEMGWTDNGGHAKPNPYKSCEFRTVNAPPGTEAEIIKHEIGHCLGLDHDGYTNSIMYSDQEVADPGNLESSDTRRFPKDFSDDDVEAVRSRYLEVSE